MKYRQTITALKTILRKAFRIVSFNNRTSTCTKQSTSIYQEREYQRTERKHFKENGGTWRCTC